MPVREDNRDENIIYAIVRVIFLIIAIVFIAYVWFFKPECGIDKEFLACNVTGSVGDILGSILFIGALVYGSGIIKGVRQLMAPPGSAKLNLLFLGLALLGIAFILLF